MIKKIILLLFVFILLLISDVLLVKYLKLEFINNRNIFWTHFFLFSITLFFFIFYKWLQKRKTKSPFILLSLSFIKMIFSLIFLYPIISTNLPSATSYIFHFFIFYFVYLLTEIFFLIKDSR